MTETDITPLCRGPELHLHFHGVAPEDVAAIIRQQEDQP
jgi:hypothetical protein